MKGLIAGIVGVALTVSSGVAPTVIADESGEVHYWSTTEYQPADRTMTVETSDGMVTAVGPGMTMAPGTRVYVINDDPTYDLSGAGDHWFLIGDGTAFRDDSWNTTAAFVSAGGARHEIVPIPAEYRQDWLAVAAGDRPVRTLVAPRSVMETTEMAVPTSVVYTNNGASMYADTRYTNGYTNGTQYRAKPVKRTHVHRKGKTVRYSNFKHREVAPASYTTTEYREPVVEPAMAAAAVEVKQDQMGNELFQIHSTWYMQSNGDWHRGESWRGPFVRVKTGSVPREVRMSAKHESRSEMMD